VSTNITQETLAQALNKAMIDLDALTDPFVSYEGMTLQDQQILQDMVSAVLSAFARQYGTDMATLQSVLEKEFLRATNS
jgi:hypothetical protein